MRLLLCFLLGVPLWAQFFGGSSNLWRRLTVPYASTITYDLTKASAFETVLTGNAVAVFAQVDKADGKLVTFRICQDPAGGRSLTWPDNAYGAADLTPAAGICTLQTFLVAGGNLWSIAAGTGVSTVPKPSMLKAPLVGGNYFGSGGLALTNESTGVAISNSAPNGNWYGYGQIRSSGSVVPGVCSPNCADHWGISATFYVDAPQSSNTLNFAIYTAALDSDLHNTQYFAAVGCGFQVGPGGGQVVGGPWFGASYDPQGVFGSNWWYRDNGWWKANVAAGVGTSAAKPISVKVAPDKWGKVNCAMTADGGTTWTKGNIAYADWAGWNPINTDGWDNMRVWALVAMLPDTQSKVHLTALSTFDPGVGFSGF